MFFKYISEMVKAPFGTLVNLYRYRHLLFQMVLREIKGRFAGSMGGLLWHFIHPVLMLLTYLFLFVYVFRLRMSSGGGAGASALYLMAGLFPWMIMAEGLLRGTSSLFENANLIQKTYFPTEILPTKAVLAPFINYGIAMVLLALFRIITSQSLWILCVLPFILVIQIMFTLGIAFLSTTLSVFFRDIIQLVQIVINFWIYATPILYPIDMLPVWAQRVMMTNPLYPLMSMYQSLFVYGDVGQWQMVLLALAWSVGFFVSGAFIFNKLKYEFADWL